MEKQLPTYENDEDFYKLAMATLSENLILDFFFKKGGTVNINNFTYLYTGQNHVKIGQYILDLQAKGLIKPSGSHCYVLTGKARWERIIDNKALVFIIAIAGLIVGVLALIL